MTPEERYREACRESRCLFWMTILVFVAFLAGLLLGAAVRHACP